MIQLKINLPIMNKAVPSKYGVFDYFLYKLLLVIWESILHVKLSMCSHERVKHSQLIKDNEELVVRSKGKAWNISSNEMNSSYAERK